MKSREAGVAVAASDMGRRVAAEALHVKAR
jgi:hypothetical protein